MTNGESRELLRGRTAYWRAISDPGHAQPGWRDGVRPNGRLLQLLWGSNDSRAHRLRINDRGGRLVQVSTDALNLLSTCINEAIEAVGEWEFTIRLGFSAAEARTLMRQVDEVLATRGSDGS